MPDKRQTKLTPLKKPAWSAFRVDSRLPSPRYQQVFRHLRNCIYDGTLARGQPIPSEHQLIDAFGISRVTVRRSLEELVSHGLITRHQGKASLVAPYKPQTSLVATVEGLVENNRLMGHQTTVKLLACEYIPASQELATKLKVRRGQKILWTVRLRSLGSTPFSYAVTYLPSAIASKIDPTKMSTVSLISLLESAGIQIGRAEQSISATAANKQIAKALQTEKNAALLLSERLVYDVHDNPVEFISVVYRPEIYHYGIELVRTKSGNGKVWASNAA
jgi:GntR family transcriptional regulator